MAQTPHPAPRKRGNALGFLIFQAAVRVFGLRFAYGILYFVCLYYLLFDRQAVSGALAYIKRRFPGKGFFGLRRRVYGLFISQGKQLIDRYAAVSGGVKFDTTLEGGDNLTSLLAGRTEGFILLTAHVGNWQSAVMALQYLKRTVHLVMRPEDNPQVEKSLGIRKEESFLRFISPEEGPDGVVKIMAAIKEGGVVAIMGDRKYQFDALGAEFLGDTAYFPYGAFTIAAALGCPMVVLLSAKTGTKKYVVDIRNVIRPRYDRPTEKKKQLAAFVQQFARVLEDYTARYPYQCFLFHDIWKNQ